MMQKEGKTPIEAIIEAARMRLRPILMTSLAFILGVLRWLSVMVPVLARKTR